MSRDKIAWRGFVTHENEVIAWPTLLTDHNEFHRAFSTTDKDFSARWRQWSPGAGVDFDPGASPEAKQAVTDWLAANA